MTVLVINIEETSVKLLVSGQDRPRTFSASGLTPPRMVTEVRKIVADWKYDVVSIGYPGLVLENRPLTEADNLGSGWARFDFKAAFRCPVRIVSTSVLQALGSYKGGRMLYLRIGNTFGSALVVHGTPIPMELGCLPYKKGTIEDYVGLHGVQRLGKKKWRHHVALVLARLIAAVHPDDVALGGRYVRNLKQLPAGCRAGDDANIFLGGFRLWDNLNDQQAPALHRFLPQYPGNEDNGDGVSNTTYYEAPTH